MRISLWQFSQIRVIFTSFLWCTIVCSTISLVKERFKENPGFGNMSRLTDRNRKTLWYNMFEWICNYCWGWITKLNKLFEIYVFLLFVCLVNLFGCLCFEHQIPSFSRIQFNVYIFYSCTRPLITQLSLITFYSTIVVHDLLQQSRNWLLLDYWLLAFDYLGFMFISVLFWGLGMVMGCLFIFLSFLNFFNVSVLNDKNVSLWNIVVKREFMC